MMLLLLYWLIATAMIILLNTSVSVLQEWMIRVVEDSVVRFLLDTQLERIPMFLQILKIQIIEAHQ
jgi:hypothetical protein